MAKFCPKCGTELKEGENFCSNCGNASETTNNSEQVNTTVTAVKSEGKSKMVAGLLGIFLGGWGIHNFYLGYTGRGIAQIFVTLFTCGFGAIWGLIEGILILTGSINTDANGNPLVD